MTRWWSFSCKNFMINFPQHPQQMETNPGIGFLLKQYCILWNLRCRWVALKTVYITLAYLWLSLVCGRQSVLHTTSAPPPRKAYLCWPGIARSAACQAQSLSPTQHGVLFTWVVVVVHAFLVIILFLWVTLGQCQAKWDCSQLLSELRQEDHESTEIWDKPELLKEPQEAKAGKCWEFQASSGYIVNFRSAGDREQDSLQRRVGQMVQWINALATITQVQSWDPHVESKSQL